MPPVEGDIQRQIDYVSATPLGDFDFFHSKIEQLTDLINVSHMIQSCIIIDTMSIVVQRGKKMADGSRHRPRGPGRSAAPVPAEFPRAVKRMIAYQIEREMLRQNYSRARLAEEMNTSRAAVNRLLNPDNRSVTLQTLERAAEILGKKLEIYFS